MWSPHTLQAETGDSVLLWLDGETFNLSDCAFLF